MCRTASVVRNPISFDTAAAINHFRIPRRAHATFWERSGPLDSLRRAIRTIDSGCSISSFDREARAAALFPAGVVPETCSAGQGASAPWNPVKEERAFPFRRVPGGAQPPGRRRPPQAQRTLNLGGGAEIRRYAYDSAGRLSRVTDGSGGLLESYQYDHEGRRLADISPQRFRGEQRYSYNLGNRLGQAGATQYGHDKAGFRNLKIEGGSSGQRETHYQYEPSGLLLRVDPPDGRRIDYATTPGASARRSASTAAWSRPIAGWTRCGWRSSSTVASGGGWRTLRAGLPLA